MSDSDSQVLECETDSEPDEVGEADEGPDQYRHWVHTTYGYYPPDQKDSKLVRAARVGNLPSVMALLEKCDLIDRAKVINAARKWTEVQDRWGFDEALSWFGDTPLVAAARAGQEEVVRALLVGGADPTLQACPAQDVLETALQAAHAAVVAFQHRAEALRVGTFYILDSDVWKEPHLAVSQLLQSLNNAKTIFRLLQVAEKYWSKAYYSSAKYSKERIKAFMEKPNKPSCLQSLSKALDRIVPLTCVELCDLSLVSDYAAIQARKREEVKRKRPQEFRPRNVVSVLSCHDLTARAGRVCGAAGCWRKAARACHAHRCGLCCPGGCPRHAAVGDLATIPDRYRTGDYSLAAERMMAGMGWRAGAGLGRQLQGRTEQVEFRGQPVGSRRGLGLTGPTSPVQSDDETGPSSPQAGPFSVYTPYPSMK